MSIRALTCDVQMINLNPNQDEAIQFRIQVTEKYFCLSTPWSTQEASKPI